MCHSAASTASGRRLERDDRDIIVIHSSLPSTVNEQVELNQPAPPWTHAMSLLGSDRASKTNRPKSQVRRFTHRDTLP